MDRMASGNMISTFVGESRNHNGAVASADGHIALCCGSSVTIVEQTFNNEDSVIEPMREQTLGYAEDHHCLKDKYLKVFSESPVSFQSFFNTCMFLYFVS